eukprot:TRINITY_DN505_c0_g1_i5.p1 TRINITY_DN505_c0_g1~~TRINITY_DN505_c0_g1_i5.p1  ORF type:complete len:198 (-),score=52.87 TRINITY_DN505_c0_g1_i5:181-774(-)
MNFFERLGENNAFIQGVSEKVGLKPGFVSMVLFGVAFILLYQGVTSGFLFFLLGVFIPGYDSFRAIESPQKDDDTRMLGYWCSFSFVLVLDGFLQPNVSFTFFSGVLRLLIIAFLSFNNYDGSKMVYDYFIGPLMRAYRNDIDTTYKSMKRSLSSLGKSIKQGMSSGYAKAKHLVETGHAEAEAVPVGTNVTKEKSD